MIINPGIRRTFNLRGGIPLANLAARFDANIGVTSASGLASQWNDISGNSRHLLQATGGNQPIHLPYVGTKYGWLPGVAGNNFSTPDAPANSITGDIAIVMKLSMDGWTPATDNALFGKYTATGNQISYLFYMSSTGGRLHFLWSSNGSTTTDKTCSAQVPFSDGNAGYVAVTLDVDNGAAGSDCKFWTSTDGMSWSQLGTTQTTAGATSIFDGTSIVQISNYNSAGGTSSLAGKSYTADLYNGIPPMLGGAGSASPVQSFDASRWTTGTTFTASTGETWTINSTGSKPAQIVDRPSLLFDGAAHYMKCNSFTLNQPETVYLVAKQVSWTNADRLFDGNTLNSMSFLQNSASPLVIQYSGAFGASINGPAIGTAGVMAVVFNGASSSVQINSGAVVTGNAGANNAGGFTLGAEPTPSSYGNIQVNEALIYSAAHDAATRANVIRALMTKWSVT